ncbi:MAG: ABC transporter ATP-binding protein [Caulobacterales bacterium]|nr:ABC transporter ATP-binding protein [Caulobacterales bacterium]MCA0373863.1 ATP-binding cassette domain-containing protein [Pseudomonadota bacterium]
MNETVIINDAKPAVEFSNLTKTFGATIALDNVEGKFHAGRLTGIVGPDGAGKTTLMRILATLLKPDNGNVSVANFDPEKQFRDVKDNIGYMPQRFGLYEDLSVMENMQLYAKLRKVSPKNRQVLFDRLLDFTRLAPFTARLAGRLSGGMKQKLGLACALMGEPKVLLLDEPGVGVDPVSRQDLWRMVEDLTSDGMAVVWSTSYLDEAEKCESVMLLNEGKVLYDGAPQKLTDTLEGRCFLINGRPQIRRQTLLNALKLPSVADGVIQGSSIRIVERPNADLTQLRDLVKSRESIMIPTKARFEDAFVDLLGGGPSGESQLAKNFGDVVLNGENAVLCQDLTKVFGEFTATDNVNFEVKKGEIFGLLGPNGAGKSTTFKMLCGLLQPTSGIAKVAGYDLRNAAREAKSNLGYMAQKFSLYSILSVKQNLEFSAGVYGLDGALKRDRIDEMIEIFHLQKYLNASPDSLPLGFKQRLALSCALMHRPPVLFLDEPTSGVDPITRREFWIHINGLVERGVTIMVTTHFMEEAEYCDRVAMMYGGKLIALDTPDELKKSVVTKEMQNPTMEDAFIELIARVDAQNAKAKAA